MLLYIIPFVLTILSSIKYDINRKNDIWEKYMRRLLISGIFRRLAERNSDKESSHVVGIIRNSASARTCHLLQFGGEPP